MENVVIEWDGTEVPLALRDLPPGRYLVESLDESFTLTRDEEAGLMRAMDALDAGDGRPLDEVLSRALVAGSADDGRLRSV